MSQGHPYAWRYPLGMLADEERLVRQRQDQQSARQLAELNLAVAAVISQQAARDLHTRVKELTNVET